MGTRDGLNLFNPITLNFLRLNTVKGTKVKINAIAVLNDDNVLIGSDEGLFSLNISSQSFKFYNFPIEGTIVVNCIKEVNKKFFLGTKEKGLWLLNGKKARTN